MSKPDVVLCSPVASGGERGRLHLNSGWVMIDPVDRNYRSVAHGLRALTSLLTNPAEHCFQIVQYLLRRAVRLGSGRQGGFTWVADSRWAEPWSV